MAEALTVEFSNLECKIAARHRWPTRDARCRDETGEAEDRRVDQVVAELERYNIALAGLQETKWFGTGVYSVGESVVLASGRPVPVDNQPKTRGEGVALVLAGPARQAWYSSGKQWKPWSSRVVSATLQVGNGRERFHVVSCYAPTFAARRETKDDFYACLQEVLSAIPPQGDFNARIGSRTVGSDWGGALGPHGFGNLNDAGRELLTFLAINEATVCNTWFQKKDIHKQTWQHPRSKV